MSKCPDAKMCQTLFQPILSQLSSIIELKVDYIATITPETNPPVVNNKTQTQKQTSDGYRRPRQFATMEQFTTIQYNVLK
jgi:hypothetical protein